MRRLMAVLVSVGLLLFLALPVFITSLLRYRSPNDHRGEAHALTVRLITGDGKTLEVDLEEYVAAVVSQEMPTSFGVEALAAQAIAARTYAYYRLYKTPGTLLSVDPCINQAWAPITRWMHTRRVAEAVETTLGMIITYGGSPIDAVYHSTCGGRTASAEEVWGRPEPYLRSVICRYCVDSPKLTAEYTLTTSELSRILSVTDLAAHEIRVLATSASGRAARVGVGNREFTARAFREALELPSTRFTVTRHADGVTFAVTGYGHGVGMCQYGAQGMAKLGYGYREILAHYYPGTSVTKLGIE